MTAESDDIIDGVIVAAAGAFAADWASVALLQPKDSNNRNGNKCAQMRLNFWEICCCMGLLSGVRRIGGRNFRVVVCRKT